MKNMDNFCYAKETITCNHQIIVSKDKRDTMEDPGKSIKKVLHILLYAKRHKATSNIEKN